MPGKILACLEATAAEGTASAEIARQAAGRSSVRGAVADELIAGLAGALVDAGGGKGKTQVVVRDGHGDLKLTEVKEAPGAYQFVEAFNALIAAGGAGPHRRRPARRRPGRAGRDRRPATFCQVLRSQPAGADPDDVFDALR
jgi:hypothetical protein